MHIKPFQFMLLCELKLPYLKLREIGKHKGFTGKKSRISQ